MAKSPSRPPAGSSSQRPSRRAVADQMRNKQKRADRRRNMAIVGACALIAFVIIGAAAFRPVKDWWDLRQFNAIDLAEIGAPASACGELTTKTATGNQDHVTPGTEIDYADAPPAFGRHYDIWDSIERKFYTAADRPDVGELVHNLEHGYTVLWYDETIADDEAAMDDLRGIAQKYEGSDNLRLKFKAVPWTEEDGEPFPDGPARRADALGHLRRGRGGRGPRGRGRAAGGRLAVLRGPQRRGRAGVHARVPLHQLPRAARPVTRFHAVVPAGGAGTRLWPLSRQDAPKFLLDLTGAGRTLLQQTVDRLVPLCDHRVVVVTGRAHADAVRAQLPDLAAEAVVAEPSPRDSMAAIGLAAALLERSDPEAVLGSFAADHVITDPEAFRRCVERAVAAAADGWLVTIGIQPTHPATGFGYIEVGGPLDGAPAHHADAFVEKPDATTARGYAEGGRHLWNAGMFVVRPGVLLDLLAGSDPGFAADLRAIAADPGRTDELWEGLPRIALDHAVAEPAAAAGRVAVVPGDLGWDDVGDFGSLAGILPPVDGGPQVLGDAGLVRSEDAGGLVVPAGGRTVAVVGLDDVVVVDTGDAVLVTTRERAQDVKRVVDGLRADGRDDLL